jgi:hypothetical protein
VGKLPTGIPDLPDTEIYNFFVSMDIQDPQRQRTLLKLASLARGRKARDPRDLIFALLGMVESTSARILADYSKPLVEVYALAAHFSIKESPHSLDFLTYTGTQLLVDPLQQWETWPSWVPSFPYEHLSRISRKRLGSGPMPKNRGI